jgi:hypothetical protein
MSTSPALTLETLHFACSTSKQEFSIPLTFNADQRDLALMPADAAFVGEELQPTAKLH